MIYTVCLKIFGHTSYLLLALHLSDNHFNCIFFVLIIRIHHLRFSSGDSNQSSLSQYSGLAGMAGISLPSESNQTTEAIGRVNSYDFFVTSIVPAIKIEDLMAVKKWDSDKNFIEYDQNIYQSSSNKWVRDHKSPKPTLQESYLEFQEIMNVSEDIKTKFVTISITHTSPFVAKDWVSLIVYSINESMRELNKTVTLKSIDFLDNQLKKVSYDGVKKSISNLQKEQINKLMRIEAKEDYIFKIIEPPYVPELKSGPKRFQITILSTIIGFVLSLFTLIIYLDIKKRNQK